MTKPHTTLSEAVRALELPAEAGAWSSPLRYGSKIGFPKPVKPQDWDDDEQDWFCNPYYSADQVHALLESVAKLVEQHEAQEPFGPIVAYASSSEFRRNQLLSKAQYDNCLPKNRVDFDIPLVAVSKCDMCNDNGSVGFPPDDYYPCPKCTPPTLAATQARDALALAYGYLWHVGAGIDAPPECRVLTIPTEEAARRARKALFGLLTHEQLGEGIRAVIAAMTPTTTRSE